MAREIKIIEKKLGKHKVHGFACFNEHTIEIDPRLKDCKRLEILLHEALHLIFPFLDELEVQRGGEELSAVLWKDGWRKRAVTHGPA